MISEEKSKKLKILLMGVVAIIVGVSVLLLKPSKRIGVVGGFLSGNQTKIELAELALRKKTMSQGEINELRILIRNNDNVTHHVSVIIEHNPKVRIEDPNITVTNEKAVIDFPAMSQGMGIERTIKFSGGLGDLISKTEYTLKIKVISDSKPIITKDLTVTVKR